MPPLHGVKAHTIARVKGSSQWLSPHTDVCHLNVSAQPSTQQTRSIRSAHGKYNPSRALVNGFCLLRANIVAFRHCFQLNWSDVKATSGSQSYFFPSLSSSHGHWLRNAPQTLRARCVVSGQWWCIGGWIRRVVGLMEHVDTHLLLVGTSREPEN